MEGSRGYTVKICNKETVAPALPQQEHWLQLSNIDLLLPPEYVGVFLCYTKPQTPLQTNSDVSFIKLNSDASFHGLVTVLKESLAKTLITYYALAGEVVVSPMGEPELLCNNRGAEFIEAYADIKLAEIDFHDVNMSFECKLLPKEVDCILTIQVTEMKCGGVVVGCLFDHRICDGYSFHMFLIAWTHTAAGKELPSLPSFRRSLLSPRRPLKYSASFDRYLIPATPLPSASDNKPLLDTVSRLYYITSDDIDQMQQLATKSGKSPTKLEAFTAYLWKLVGRAGEDVAQIGIVVDGRKRMNPTMDSYFGNTSSLAEVSMMAEKMRVEDVAETVHQMIAAVTSEEHFREMVDWVEARRPVAAKGMFEWRQDGGKSVLVSSGRGFSMTEVQFGWGTPALGFFHLPWPHNNGYVMPLASTKGNGDWVIYMQLTRPILAVVDADSDGYFRKLTTDYLFI